MLVTSEGIPRDSPASIPLLAAGSRSKNSATNQKRAYRVGTDLVHTGYAHIWPGILWGVRMMYGVSTEWVRTEGGLG